MAHTTSRSNPPTISVLRTRLQHECSDLKCLTDSELAECKWSTKKKVYSHLFALSPSLEEFSEHLQTIQEERNLELAQNKSKPIDRNQRQEEEMAYRTQFLRIIISGLTKLRWPPTLEAFSDPMVLLFNDNFAVMDSFQFILDVAIPKSVSRFERESSATSALSSTSSLQFDVASPRGHNNSPNHKFTPPRPPLHNSLHHHHQADDITSATHSNRERTTKTPPIGMYSHREIGSDPILGSGSSMEVSHGNRHSSSSGNVRGDDNSVDISRISVNDSTRQDIDMSTTNDGDYMRQPFNTPLPNTPQHFQHQVQLQHQLQHVPPSSARSVRSNMTTRSVKPVTMREEFSLRAFEILQAQNEQLRRKLKLIEDATVSRSAAEYKMSAIISDLKATVQDIVGIGGSESLSNKNSNNNSTSFTAKSAHSIPLSAEKLMRNKPVTARTKDEEEDLIFQQEIAREELKRDAAKNKSLGINAVDTEVILLCSNCKGALKPSSSGANDTVNKSVLPRHESTSTTSSSSTHIWTRLQSKINAIESQWNDAVNIHKHARNTPLSQHPLTVEQFMHRCGGGGVGGSPLEKAPFNSAGAISGQGGVDVAFGGIGSSSVALTRQALGVHRQLSGATRSVVPNIGGDDGETAHGLDVARVHQLQRDLVKFTDSTFEFLTNSLSQSDDSGDVNNMGNSDMKSHGSKLSLESQAQKRHNLTTLQDTACQLLLHLACLAPIAPLAVDSPYTSSMTGLETFIEEALIALGPKANKATMSKLQSAADRAKSEQVTLVRCLVANRNGLKQWCAYSDKMTTKLTTLGAKYSHMINKTTGEIKNASDAVTSILNAYNDSEKARVPPSLFNSSNSSSGSSDSSVLSARSSGHISDTASVGSNQTNSSSKRLPFSANAPVLVCPLDPLLRGVAGKEVTMLIDTMRMYRDELADLPVQLNELSQKLKVECKAETVLIDNFQSNLANAAKKTRDSNSVMTTPHASSAVAFNTEESVTGNVSSRRRTAAQRVASTAGGGGISQTIQQQRQGATSGTVASASKRSGSAGGRQSGAGALQQPQWDSGTSFNF